MKKALVAGGSSGVGLSLVFQLLADGYDHIYVAAKAEYPWDVLSQEQQTLLRESTTFLKTDLTHEDYSWCDSIRDIDTLIITAGFGRVALFEDLVEKEISNLVKCNELAVIQIIRKYYDLIKSDRDFHCAVMVSISGHLASPYFSVYGATKSALASFIENINTELNAAGCKNRILDVSPGSLKGTAFNGKANDIREVESVAKEILQHMRNRDTLFIPDYEKTFKNVLERYHNDPVQFGLESYEYKANSARVSGKPQIVIGYLSGTFDLFHIGHLNLLRRAKAECDYLIVGVHKSGAWKGKETYIPFEERTEIVRNIRYVDKVIESYREDADAWSEFHYDKLFVGSDYKGTERFLRYEEYFADKGVEIVYFPYTQGTSSTQLRDAIAQK